MSRKLRSSEVLEQLGEPLPLPYMTESPKPIVDNTSNEPTQSSANTLAQQMKRRKIRISSGESRGESRGEVRVESRGESLGMGTEPSGMGHRRLRQFEKEIERETILDKIQQKLVLLKLELSTDKDIQSERAILEYIYAELEEMLSRRNKNDILAELDRLKEQEHEKEDSDTNSKWFRLVLIIAVVIAMLVISFLAGHFSYEYCYYFC